MKLDIRFSPDLGELSPEEARKLGELVEHPSWNLFVKYLHIERWATMNNGFIKAKDGIEFGYCQGDVGRINKIESDMSRYHEISVAQGQVDNMQKESNDVTESLFSQYSDDEDMPLVP